MQLPSSLWLRPIGHDDDMTVVAHLDELRTRLIVSLLAVTVAFGICFWQNQRLLTLIDAPLARQTQQHVRDGQGPLGATYAVMQNARDVAEQLRVVVGLLDTANEAPTLRSALQRVGANLSRDISHLSAPPQGDRPVTLGVGEPFTTTATVSLIFALIFSLPVLLAQAYAFLIPAITPQERRRMKPLAFAIPLLFVTGVAFGYLVVLPAAIHFLQNFNSNQFNVLVQAGPYYKFAATTILAMGLLFEIPVAILAVTRTGVITPRQLRKHRRYAIAACVAIAALLPGDLVTMLLELVPLYLLFELSLVIATLADRSPSASAPAAQPTIYDAA